MKRSAEVNFTEAMSFLRDLLIDITMVTVNDTILVLKVSPKWYLKGADSAPNASVIILFEITVINI